MYLCLCVRVYLCLHVCVHARVYLCVCVCVRERERESSCLCVYVNIYSIPVKESLYHKNPNIQVMKVA